MSCMHWLSRFHLSRSSKSAANRHLTRIKVVFHSCIQFRVFYAVALTPNPAGRFWRGNSLMCRYRLYKCIQDLQEMVNLYHKCMEVYRSGDDSLHMTNCHKIVYQP